MPESQIESWSIHLQGGVVRRNRSCVGCWPFFVVGQKCPYSLHTSPMYLGILDSTSRNRIQCANKKKGRNCVEVDVTKENRSCFCTACYQLQAELTEHFHCERSYCNKVFEACAESLYLKQRNDVLIIHIDRT